jgi:hypothetical protein
MQWKSVRVPSSLVERIHKVQTALGYASMAVFVAESIRRNLVGAERKVDEIEQEREVGRKVLGKEDL